MTDCDDAPAGWRRAGQRERAVGVAWYASDVDGVGGRLRDRPEDFRVREVEGVDPAPVDADPGSYPYLLVRATLRDWDTNAFVDRLAAGLGASRERVSWAGTKDKRAVTTQLLAVRDAAPDGIPDIEGAELHAVGRLGRALAFGDLVGNRFEVRVSAPTAPDSAAAVTAALQELATGDRRPDGGGGTTASGDGRQTAVAAGDDPATIAVPNYFGHQRFGSRRQVTHEVGLAVVRGEWRAAVLAYCGQPDEREPDGTREARRFVDEQAARDEPDWAAAAERLPSPLGHERAMLQRLAEHDGARAGSGVESRWYDALTAVPTSLQRLFVAAAQSYVFNRIVSARVAAGLPLATPVAGDVVAFVDRTAADHGVAAVDVDRTQRVGADEVAAVTRHCRRGRAIVTAPLVGTDTRFADGQPGEVVRSVCDAVGVSPGDFDLPEPFVSSGTRRAVLARTDIGVERDDDALDLSFALPSGAYATTVLREYTKTDPERL